MMIDNSASNVKRSVDSHDAELSESHEDESSSKRFKAEGRNGSRFANVDFNIDVESQFRCLMKTGDAGAIIGKSGSNIKRLRSEYNLALAIPNSMSIERVFTMRGTIHNMGECLYECFKLIHEDKGETPEEELMVESRMLIHSPYVGGLIGFKGERIKEIREKTRAEIKIYEDCCPGSTERVFKIDGSVHNVVFCIMYVLHLLTRTEIKQRGRHLVEYDPINSADLNDGMFRNEAARAYAHPQPPRAFSDDVESFEFGRDSFQMGGGEPVFFEDHGGPVNTVTLTVAAENAGAIIGTGGRNINVARQRSRADIKVEDGKHDGAPRQVIITGTDSQISYAKFLIQQFVREDRGRGGNRGGGGGDKSGGGGRGGNRHGANVGIDRRGGGNRGGDLSGGNKSGNRGGGGSRGNNSGNGSNISGSGSNTFHNFVQPPPVSSNYGFASYGYPSVPTQPTPQSAAAYYPGSISNSTTTIQPLMSAGTGTVPQYGGNTGVMNPPPTYPNPGQSSFMPYGAIYAPGDPNNAQSGAPAGSMPGAPTPFGYPTGPMPGYGY